MGVIHKIALIYLTLYNSAMNTITFTQVNKAKRGLEEITREARRRLFEFETLANLYDIQQGKVFRHKTAKSFMRSLVK